MVDKKDGKDSQNSEPIQLKVFKKSIKFDILQAIDDIVNGLAHPLAIDSLSLKEREEYTNMVIKIIDESVQEVMVEIKERARLVIKAYQEQEQMIEKVKKINGQQVN